MFLPIEIDNYGYIRALSLPRVTIHRETRNIHLERPVCALLSDAKALLRREDQCVLELTREGGGKCIWMRDDQRALLEPRLRIFRTCYGKWSIRTLNDQEEAWIAAPRTPPMGR